MSMAHGLEVRVPLIDHQLARLILSLPGARKLDPGMPKPLLVRALAGQLPDSIVHRPKRGFTLPFEHWLRDAMRPMVEKSLRNIGDGPLASLLDRSAARTVWDDFISRPNLVVASVVVIRFAELVPAAPFQLIAMQKAEDLTTPANAPAANLPVSVIIPVRNEAQESSALSASAPQLVDEVYVIDSQSTDATTEIARSHGAKVVQFHYLGGWPKKRQWAMDTLPFAHNWILLLDADEVLTPELAAEIREAIRNPTIDGYFIQLRIWFLGRLLRHGDVGLWKMSLFRRGKGHYECRLKDQDASMADMEVHEHVVVDGCNREAAQSAGSSQCRVAFALHPEA